MEKRQQVEYMQAWVVELEERRKRLQEEEADTREVMQARVDEWSARYVLTVMLDDDSDEAHDNREAALKGLTEWLKAIQEME